MSFLQLAMFVHFTGILCLEVGLFPQIISASSFRLTSCACSNDVVTYECTVCEEFATVWEGTAFRCSAGEITLANSDFGTPEAVGVCNDIIGHGLFNINGCYTSKLNVTFDAALQNRSIECFADNGTHITQRIGRAFLQESTEPFPPPESLQLTGVNSTVMIFSWNQTQLDCPSLYYNILQTNCGVCPDTTNNTMLVCSGFPTSDSITLCNFMVQVVICRNSDTPIFGNFSSTTVNLTVPKVSQVLSIPHYHIRNGLRRLTVNFSTVSPLDIYEGINGSTISYSITYSDSISGSVCSSDTIPAAECLGGSCSSLFEIESSSCSPSASINVTVFATTILGDGPASNPIMEDYRNNLVEVQLFSQSTSINCTFLNLKDDIQISCNATVIFGANCENQRQIMGTSESGNLVLIKLRDFLVETMPSEYCSFIVSATAGTKVLTVEGDLAIFSLDSGSSYVLAIVLPIVLISVVAIMVLIILVCFMMHKRRIKYTITSVFIPTIHPVTENCNMIEFAKKCVSNYDPDSGKGYYQLVDGDGEYISRHTDVILISKDKEQICTGSQARKMIGFKDEQTPVKLSNLKNDTWKYIFIQSTSRIRTLPKGTHFIYYGMEDECTIQAFSPKRDERKLDIVGKDYYQLYPVTEDCQLAEFTKNIPGLMHRWKLGYGFYELTKPEYISFDKQVILMDKDGRLYYGPGARRMIINPQEYDETKEIPFPNFSGTKWKCAFVQARSNVRVLKANTSFLYCNIASTEMFKVTAPFKIFLVNEEDEDKRKRTKFAKERIPYYNPRSGYGYYEFTKPTYVLPERNIIGLNKNGNLFTGSGFRQLIGAGEDYDGTTEIDAPDLSDTEWDCIFIQGLKSYGRVLERGTRFLYCEYDHKPQT